MSRKRKIGDLYAIKLPDGKYAFGRVMKDAGLAIYKKIEDSTDSLPSAEEYMFIISVFDYVFKEKEWSYIKNIPFQNEDESWPPKRSVYDVISNSYSIYFKGEFCPSTEEECMDLEIGKVWDSNTLIDRIMDDGKQN